uniref:Uncharacterized protein n=1 Tax=Amphimedon queenslandica TaxID=400682 RepID=A0A1X7SVW0_AMPQE
MCQIAYTNLANTTMTFSSHQLQSLSEAVKEDYLGLMTTFTEYDEEKYQFLHLSIQEFLAAWWITKHEKKTEEVFKDHFDDDHFRMCLRFVAGLTHLEHESYQQYFNKQQLDLQCKRKPLFGFETCHLSYFYQNPEIRHQKFVYDHIRSDDFDNVPILLVQLLYESQNTTLCQFLNLPQLKILHLIMEYPILPTVDNTYYTDKCTELEKCIEMNSTLQEMKIDYNGKNEITSTIISVIRGVTRNKTITSLTIHADTLYAPPPPLPDGVIEQLLKDNNTLQALSLDLSDDLLPSSLNIVEVNTPLTALEIRRGWSSKLMTSSLLPHIKGLHCLILHDPYPPYLLFLSHPSLHTLTLPLDTAESAIELFTILQTNTTLKALSVKIKDLNSSMHSLEEESRMGSSSSSLVLHMLMQDLQNALNVAKVYYSLYNGIQNILTENQTLKYLVINNDIPSSFLSFLTTGLRHNTSLQQLSVFIPLNEEIRTFINVISQKNNLTELKVLPAVTNMLQSHTTIRLLRIGCRDSNKESSQPNWIEL